MSIKMCLHCGEKPARRKWCSERCATLHYESKRTAERRARWQTRPCPICQAPFANRRTSKTCSPKCSTTYATIKSRSDTYGISPEQFLILQTVDLCGICGRNRKEASKGVLQIDHDHETETVREPICGQCNTILGMAHDNISILEACIAYLRYWGKIPRGLEVREYVEP